MARLLFNQIVIDVSNHDSFFRTNMDCAGRQAISGLLKCTSAIRQLAYDVHADFLDEYVQINERTSRTALDHFCQAVMEIYGPEFLRKPTVTDIEKLYRHHEEKHRPDHGPNPFISLEAVASQDLWIWHAFFVVVGSNNDINVLYQSPLFNDLKTGRAPEISFVANGRDLHLDLAWYSYYTHAYIEDGVTFIAKALKGVTWRNQGIHSKPNLNFRAVHKSYTSIFVSNIPWKATVQDLWNSCNQWGVVIDVYIATKRSKSGHRFGFVRFKNVNDINLLVSNLRVTWMSGFHLFADVAKYDRTNNRLEKRFRDSKPNEDIEDCFKNVTEKCRVVNNNMSNDVEGEILEDHFDGDRRNNTIEDNANVNPSTNVYLDGNQNTSIPEVVEDFSSLDRSSDKAKRLAHHNNGLDDLDISLRNMLLHQDKCRVRPVKAAVNDSRIVSLSMPPTPVLNLAEDSCSTWLDYVGPLITDELDSEKRWSYRDPDRNVQGSFSLVQLRMWKDYFPSDIKIWSYYGNVKETILLHNALKRRTKDAY
nr:putative nuclease HARBI1 [Tanacetum cinerariifolium]